MSAAGFDLNLGPLADVATIDSPVADRAYGDDAELVARLTAAALRGCKEGKIACAVSHFPGLGAASDDTAVSPATVGLDAASLASRDLVPFRAALDAGAPAVPLPAFYAAYDPVTPAALSPAIAGDLLRRELGFKGVAITDDLSSGAVAAGIGAPDAAVRALAAGADMVTISEPGQAAQARGRSAPRSPPARSRRPARRRRRPRPRAEAQARAAEDRIAGEQGGPPAHGPSAQPGGLRSGQFCGRTLPTPRDTAGRCRRRTSRRCAPCSLRSSKETSKPSSSFSIRLSKCAS